MDCSGSLMVEYYDGATVFSSETDEDEKGCTTEDMPKSGSHDHANESTDGNETSPTVSACSSRSNLNLIREENCKSYHYVHTSDQEFDEEAEQEREEERMSMRRRTSRETRFFKETARVAMDHHYTINQQECIRKLLQPKESVLMCPRGAKACPAVNIRRKIPGPFLTCPLAHSHECGDEFSQLPIESEPRPEVVPWARPPQLMDRTNKLYTTCKQCENVGFMHHRNPAQHYEDYVNNVTYKRHQHHRKVWPQHLADLSYSLKEDAKKEYAHHYAEIIEKCKLYKPSKSLMTANGYQQMIWRRPAAIVPKQIQKGQKSKPEVKEEKKTEIEKKEKNGESALAIENTPGDMKRLSLKIRRPTTSFQQRLNTSVKRLMRSRLAPRSKHTKRRFVRQSFTHTHRNKNVPKNIQKGKPNISARLLRKNKGSGAGAKSKVTEGLPVTLRTKNMFMAKETFGERSSEEDNITQIAVDSPRKDEVSEDGSFAKFRDQNGNFDTEKYRQSVLKMLDKGNGVRPQRKKRTNPKKGGNSSFTPLPDIKNRYSDTKPRIVTNLNSQTLSKRKKSKSKKKKSSRKTDGAFRQLMKRISDISLKKDRLGLTEEDDFEEDEETTGNKKDAYFSIPHLV